MPIHLPRISRRRLLGAAALGAAVPALAQQPGLPGRTIHLVVPYPPGGTTDLQARAIAQKVQAQTGATLLVENKPGAGGNIGVESVLKAQPRDGTTIGITAMNSFAINPLLTRKLPYDVARDVQPITLVGSMPNIVLVHPDVPARDLQDLAKLARAGDVTYASPGAGTSVHLAAEMMADQLGVKLRHVPYRGDAPALQDVLGGRVPVMLANLPGVIEHVRAGKLRALAVTSAKRSPILPQVPTVAESGLPGFDVKAFFALFTARGVAADMVAALNREFGKAINHTDVRTQFARLGIDTAASSVEALTALIYLESRKWAPIVQKTGATWD
ncbi:Bug family tripartite tricarboxylate transporter substrate binding protein [Ramlibacter albus]|uniref:Tripartite tricarboxylate transporter substrate binding protein n=1 Tax=Ramlibacter albus TaxID=2079448 RepID=A0A923S2V8_9BURK|nr:tripartite tricarboxylate transporter substrate binding protein [Ramlibacter albus]MBC5765771.1 tripartite tricarboxylate transporter substrate binding protein [Ramlibacter albus]